MEKTDLIIPIWSGNTKKQIIESLDSIIKEHELINKILLVIDGCEVFPVNLPANHILENKIIFIYTYKNKGPGIARNIGVDYSRANNIVFLDAGDRCTKNRLRLQIKSLKIHDVSLGDIKEFSRNNKSSVRVSSRNIKEAKKIVPYRTPFNNVTIAIKRKKFIELGGYPELRTAEDWLLMGKMIKNNLNISCEKNILVEIKKDNLFLSRRKGKKVYHDIEYCLNELYRIGLTNKLQNIISLMIQRILRIYMPKIILKFIYYFFRKKI